MRRLLVIGCVWWAAACGGDDGPSRTQTISMAELCDAMSELTCAKLAECGFADASCETTLRDACCSGSSCNQTVEGVIADWRDCYAEILDETSCTGENMPSWTVCDGT